MCYSHLCVYYTTLNSTGAKGSTRTGSGIKQYKVISDYSAKDAVLAPLRLVKAGRCVGSVSTYICTHFYKHTVYYLCTLCCLSLCCASVSTACTTQVYIAA